MAQVSTWNKPRIGNKQSPKHDRPHRPNRHPLQACGAHRKNCKNKMAMGLWSLAGVVYTQEFSKPKT